MFRRRRLAIYLVLVLPWVARASEFDTASAWLPEVEQLYRADVHYSRLAACRALAHEVALHRKGSETATMDVRSATPALRTEMQNALAKLGIPVAEEGTVLEVVESVTQDELQQQLTCRLADEDVAWTVDFVAKPWVAESSPGGLVTVRGLAERDLHGKSGGVMQQAVKEVILPRVYAELGGRHRLGRRGEQLAARRVWGAIEDSSLVTDRFRQTFYTSIDGEPHEALVREAVLLDLSEEQLQGIAQPIGRDLRRVRRRISTVLWFAGGIVVVALLVARIGYVFLNRITQGYYMWPIRLATATGLALTLGIAATLTLTILNSL